MTLTIIGLLIGLLGILATFLAWLFPEQRYAVLRWLGLTDEGLSLATEPADLLETHKEAPATPKASDYINLGEHLWYLNHSFDETAENIGKSINAFTKRLDMCEFPGTRAASKCIQATTIGQLQSQMTTISSSLYSEATPRQKSFINLGEFLWYLSNPKAANPDNLGRTIRGFLDTLAECRLKTRDAAKPLEQFRIDYLRKFNLVTGESLGRLAAIMKPIRLRLEHETKELEVDS